ncbi:hypothetical protein [Streptomyces muensis]|uniref:Uncharacterized protein n=1 Tax=Streptomyces muensis TaxID=1077944 RepID=A0A9X1TPQ0_STRM4|nr:hypothetical protein [Streptomyces muensis]MCF1598014.1 hypothetical protein [Streptomyces muensis]
MSPKPDTQAHVVEGTVALEVAGRNDVPAARPAAARSLPASWQDGAMERVLGIGGHLVRAADPEGDRLEPWQPA